MTRDDIKNRIISTLEQRAVLLLGQNYLADQTGRGPLAVALADMIGGKALGEWWLTTSVPFAERTRLVADTGRAIPLDDDHAAMLRLVPWACGFTSAIDPVPHRLLHEDGRPILELSERQDHPDPTALPLFRLFGNVDRPPGDGGLPPADRKGLTDRRATAKEMLSPLAELIGPTGTLFVEGWAPATDWLRARDLGAALLGKGLGPSQVLLFGVAADDPALDDEDLQDLIATGVLETVGPTLAELLVEMRQEATLNHLTELKRAAGDVVIQVALQTPATLCSPRADGLIRVAIHPQEWRGLNETFEVLQPLAVSHPIVGTPSELRPLFRELLGRGPTAHFDRVHQFTFRRPVLDDSILPTVFELLASPSPQDTAVVLAGQSGSSKSTILAQVAVALRESGFPVVFVRRSAVPPNYGQLDRFARLVENAGAKVAVAVVYDGLLHPHEYLKLAKYLGSKGRKALVIGSSYGDETVSGKPSQRKRLHVVPVSVRMTPGERRALQHYLKGVGADDQHILRLLDDARFDNFFAFLYQLLGSGSARQRLVDGLIREVESGVAVFDQRIDEYVRTRKPTTGMNDFQLAWLEALGARPAELGGDGLPRAADPPAARGEALRLIDAVMVVGRLNLDLPQSLALRLLRTDRTLAYKEALNTFRAVEGREVRPGVYVLGARNPVEAAIWCSKRVPATPQQFDIIAEVVKCMTADEARDDRSLECDFAIRALRAVGPQGADPSARMTQEYHRIAAVVRQLRQSHGRIHERLLLLEGNGVRESVRLAQSQLSKVDEGERRKLVDGWLNELKQAEESLDAAILQSQRKFSNAATRRFMAILETEQACICGVQQGSLVRLAGVLNDLEEAKYRQMDEYLGRAVAAWRRALAHDDDNFHALDAASWIYKERLEAGHLSDAAEADLIADWHDVIDRCQQFDLDPWQMDRLDYHEGCLSAATGDLARFDEVVRRMQVRGSPGAYTMKARHMAVAESPAAARRYLEDSAGDALLSERSVLLYYYRLWWRTETGFADYFPDFHLTLGFRPDQWRRLSELALARSQMDGERESTLALFHLGWAYLQLGLGDPAREVFAHLEAASGDSFRRGRTLTLLANPDGTPRSLTAETRGGEGSRGRAWVNDLRLEVSYSMHDFPGAGHKAGRLLGPFHLALNYRGAFAQPVGRYRKASESPA